MTPIGNISICDRPAGDALTVRPYNGSGERLISFNTMWGRLFLGAILFAQFEFTAISSHLSGRQGDALNPTRFDDILERVRRSSAFVLGQQLRETHRAASTGGFVVGVAAR